MRAPADAADGRAKVTITFPDWKDATVLPSTFEVGVAGTSGRASGTPANSP